MTSISSSYYRELLDKVNRAKSAQEIIDVHLKLIGASCYDGGFNVYNCANKLITDMLYADDGRNFAYFYSKAKIDFLNSKYLSEYYKKIIKHLLSGEELSEEVINVLNSDKDTNEMSESEIKGIRQAIDEYASKEYSVNRSLAYTLFDYLLKLDGVGPISYIKNNVSPSSLADYMLMTSGLSTRASYYAGRGVVRSDLNEDNLFCIFKKVLKYASPVDFVVMVNNLQTLGATEFINAFYNLAKNGFKYDGKLNADSCSLDDLYDERRNIVMGLYAIGRLSQNDENSQQLATKRIKDSFNDMVIPYLPEEFIKDLKPNDTFTRYLDL